jgi:hypothetical protein
VTSFDPMTKKKFNHVSPPERTIVQVVFKVFIDGDVKRSAGISGITHSHNMRESIMQSSHIQWPTNQYRLMPKSSESGRQIDI